jgi:hypothetical protein
MPLSWRPDPNRSTLGDLSKAGGGSGQSLARLRGYGILGLGLVRQIGQCGQWGAAPPTKVIRKSAVVGFKFGLNEGLPPQAISGLSPKEELRFFTSMTLVQRKLSCRSKKWDGTRP